MTEEKKKERTTVKIYGCDYTIVGTEDPAHVMEVAKLVDQKMKEFRKMNSYLDSTKLAVLTAVNVVDDYIKLQKRLAELEAKVEKEDQENNA